MLNVLLVEDDRDLAETIVQYLELEGVRCDYASNGISGLQRMAADSYDALLLDLNLPRLDGLSLCERIRERGDDTPVLMPTARDRLQDKLDGFRAGTDDFLVKPFELEELVVRVRALTRRRSGQARLLRCADLEMDLTRRVVRRSGHVLKVSPIGWKLLELLLRESPAAVARERLEQAAWGDEVPPSNSLKVHMHGLRKTIDGDYPVTLVHTVSGFGFSLRDDGHETPA